MILKSLEIDPKEFEARTGWAIKPEGACKGDTCVPLSAAAIAKGKLDARAISDRLGMPLIRDDAGNVWALGPAAMGHALTTAQAPDITLPDYKGNPFKLSSLSGQKVLIVTWSSW
jgi:hypothetical protein